MPWQTFVDQCRLHGRDFYILWQSQFEFGVDDRVVCNANERIAVFGSDEEARAFASRHAENVREDSHEEFDLDAVRVWCRQPDATTLDANLLWCTWHLLKDSGVADIPLAHDGESGHEESDIFDNLLVWATDRESEWDRQHKRPWRHEEIHTLARILGEGVDKFEARLSERPGG